MRIISNEEVRREAEEAIARGSTVDDYNAALEARLMEVRCARGYTDRDPSLYANSSVERWRQDADDWAKFRDKVMLYGLEIENKHEAGEQVPTLDEFKSYLASMDCEWTYAIS